MKNKSKRSKKFIAAIIVLACGVIGLLGVFGEQGNKGSLLIGSLILIAVGAFLFLSDYASQKNMKISDLLKKKNSQQTSVKQADSQTLVHYDVERAEKERVEKETIKEEVKENIVKSPVREDKIKKDELTDAEKEKKKAEFMYSLVHKTPEQLEQEKALREQKEKEREERQQAYEAKKRAEFDAELANIPRVEVITGEAVNRKRPTDMPDIEYKGIRKNTRIETLFPLVVLDVETTGIAVRGNDIIEVSAIKFEKDFTPSSCYTTLLKPRNPIPEDATAINHITDDMVKDCPKFSQVAKSFSEYISECNIAGHNADFDLKFLFVCGADLPEKVKYYDTLKLAQYTLTKYGEKKYDHHTKEYYYEQVNYDVYDYKLETLCEHYGIYRNDAHRSLSDCLATAKVFEQLIDDKINPLEF